MKRYRFITLLMVIMFTFLMVIGCSKADEPSGNEKIAYISAKENSQYEKTFKDLNLGVLYDYHLKLPQADKSWVKIWVESYKNGEKMDPFHVEELSYGNNPAPSVEGPMGFGIINTNAEKPLFFLYSSDASIPPHEIENVLNQEGVRGSLWDYAIGKEEVALESGETLVLGVYRQFKESFRPYDYQDNDQITQMINEDMTVLLLKIRVELSSQP
ncbi:hypothetical protein EJP82_02505 [Paenibacillus anaericanus]|uniref:Lipoprotein n=1 Tax=Paenibacillus anaericanus TaxID=170367 RepID=A0A3S1DMR4_9BACL|nr:hypothetical protein [Paenibacillus anaericanus]RUT48035.1 hypothetical protein EJP82_02505 [Paenibacillus anaericanus]